MFYSSGPVHCWIAKTTVIPLTSSTIAQKAQITTSYPPSGGGSTTTLQVTIAPDVPPSLTTIFKGFAPPGFNIGFDLTQPIPPQPVSDPDEAQANDYFPAPFVDLGNLQVKGKLFAGIGGDNPTGKPAPRPSRIPKPTSFTAAAVYYLGTCEDAPIIKIRPRYKELFQTDTGKAVPYDKAYQGRDAIIHLGLNNWNEWVYRIIAARTNARTTTGAPRGVDLADSIGSLLESEGLSFQLILQYPNAAKPIMALGGQPAGYRFLSTYLLNETILPGNRPGKLDLEWHALRVHDPATGHSWLYDEDTSLCGQLG